MTIDIFTGPLTAEKISEWLSSCEEEFDVYDDAHPTQTLTNKQKIQRAMASISHSYVDSKKLHTWYNQNRKNLETKGWDTFRDLVKDYALGKGWRIKVLQNFFTYSQGLVTLDEYFQKFETLKFTVARSSNLSEIDPMVYKCCVLFGCKPDIVEKFIRAHKNDQQFIQWDVDEMRSILKDFDGEGSVPAQLDSSKQVPSTLQALHGAGLYITSGLFGGSISTTGTDATFTGISDLPTLSTAVGHVSNIYCYHNDVSTRSQIQLIQVNIGGVYINYPVVYRDINKSVTVPFSAGEYLTQVTMTRDHSISAISSVSFLTSQRKEYTIGNPIGERMTFTAPERWRIVGFHGTSGSSISDSSVPSGIRYPITRLGVIYAPYL